MSERIKTSKFNITGRDPVHLRQQIAERQKGIVGLWRSLGIDEESIQRNRNQQELEIRRCLFQLRHPDSQLLPPKSKKDRLNLAIERLDTILSGLNDAARINKMRLHRSENSNLVWGQEQSFDPNGGVIFAPNSDDHH